MVLVKRGAIVLSLGLGGCFLYPSPDASWSDAYLAAPTSDASGDGAAQVEAGVGADGSNSYGPCANARGRCLDCCDKNAGAAAGPAANPAAGTAYLNIVFVCACGSECKACGNDCGNVPDSSESCLSCLAASKAARDMCPSKRMMSECGPDTDCGRYAACNLGCQGP
jgi:hypothetical protein